MAKVSDVQPTRVETWIEAHFRGYRYGWVLVLLSITFVFMAVGSPDAWARVVTVALQGLTLLAALVASRAGRRISRIAALVVTIAWLSSILSIAVSDSHTPTGVFFALNVLLVGATPVVIAQALYRRGMVDVHTVLGAICIYVLIGMMFAFGYAAINELGSTSFFAQTSHAGLPDFLYFSFVTLTTVGYGDLTAATNLGRAVAVTEALAGQLYLVTIIAVLVSRMASRASPITNSPGPQPPEDEHQ